jgi:pyridoxal phosphate enzyme (YggS family)
MNISQAIFDLKQSLPHEVTLIAVSKTKPIEDLVEAYKAGQLDFGENKIQEMVSKWEQLPKDIRWHMIGHVQTNKVKYMAPFVSLIHAIDSTKLLSEIQKQAEKNNRIIEGLIQVRIAQEETKYGLPIDEVEALLEFASRCKNVKIKGLMGMASLSENEIQIRSEFETISTLYFNLKPHHPSFTYLSMGMSGDYTIALQLGSNMIRVGSKLFGAR